MELNLETFPLVPVIKDVAKTIEPMATKNAWSSLRRPRIQRASTAARGELAETRSLAAHAPAPRHRVLRANAARNQHPVQVFLGCLGMRARGQCRPKAPELAGARTCCCG